LVAHLGVTQNGVVEQDAKEHGAQRQNLLPRDHIVTKDLLAGFRGAASVVGSCFYALEVGPAGW